MRWRTTLTAQTANWGERSTVRTEQWTMRMNDTNIVNIHLYIIKFVTCLDVKTQEALITRDTQTHKPHLDVTYDTAV